MKNKFLYTFAAIASYSSGLIVYSLLLLNAGESLSYEFDFVFYNSLAAFLIAAVPLYAGVIYTADKKAPQFGGWLYPLGCLLVSFVPTLLIGLRFGGILLFNSSAWLFHAMFAAAGIIFGLSAWLIKSRSGWGAAAVIAGTLAVSSWLAFEIASSYKTPEEAFSAGSSDAGFIIPGYSDFFASPQRYFFIRNNELGTADAVRKPFGWKAEPIEWRKIDASADYDRLSGEMDQERRIVFGLVKLKNPMNRQVEANGEQSAIIYPLLPEHLEKQLGLKEFYIWYGIRKRPAESEKIQLIDEQSKKVIDSLQLQ